MSAYRNMPDIVINEEKRVRCFAIIGAVFGPSIGVFLMIMAVWAAANFFGAGSVPDIPFALKLFAYGYPIALLIVGIVWFMNKFNSLVSVWVVLLSAVGTTVLVLFLASYVPADVDIPINHFLFWTVFVLIFPVLPVTFFIWWFSGLASLGWSK